MYFYSLSVIIYTYAIAVLPVPGWPPIKIALPAILPSLIMLRIIPAALLALTYQPNNMFIIELLYNVRSFRANGYLPSQPFLVRFFLRQVHHQDPILLEMIRLNTVKSKMK